MNFVKCFFCVYNMFKWFLSFFLLIWYSTLICGCWTIFSLWNKSLLIMVCNFLSYYWIWFANILFSIFTSMLSKDIDLQFSCNNLLWFWYQSNVDLIKWVWRSPFSSIFGKLSRRLDISSSLSVRIHQWSHLVLDFYLLGGFLLRTQSSY